MGTVVEYVVTHYTPKGDVQTTYPSSMRAAAVAYWAMLADRGEVANLSTVVT